MRFQFLVLGIVGASAFMFQPLNHITSRTMRMAVEAPAMPKKADKTSTAGILSVIEAANRQEFIGRASSPVWSEVPEEVFQAADMAALEGGDYPPEHVPKAMWDKVKPSTFEAIASLASSLNPQDISRAQYVILTEAVVRRELRNNASFWEKSFTANEKANALSMDALLESALADPSVMVDLTTDEDLGIDREEFVFSVAQFFRAEAERFPVFMVVDSEDAEAAKTVKLFTETMGVPVRVYEVFGFEGMKIKVKAAYDWKEARVDALEVLTGSKSLPQVFVAGSYLGTGADVWEMYQQGALQKKMAPIQAAVSAKRDASTNTKDVKMVGMRIIDAEADAVKAERLKKIEELRTKAKSA